jgi:hypothetical protein
LNAHVPVDMGPRWLTCSCGRHMKLPEDYHDLSKAVRDDKLLDMHSAHAHAMKEQGR